MKADVTVLDWMEPEEERAQQEAQHDDKEPGKRRAERVPVKLRVAIDSKDAAYLTESVDISETGVLVENYDGPKLRKGKKVRVIIQGVVADEDTQKAVRALHRVFFSGRPTAAASRKE